jgi:hypothetical protein
MTVRNLGNQLCYLKNVCSTGVELRASCFLGKHSTSLVTPLTLFVLIFFQIGSHVFVQDWPQTMILLSLPVK